MNRMSTTSLLEYCGLIITKVCYDKKKLIFMKIEEIPWNQLKNMLKFLCMYVAIPDVANVLIFKYPKCIQFLCNGLCNSDGISIMILS